jgi:hypothetical protein
MQSNTPRREYKEKFILRILVKILVGSETRYGSGYGSETSGKVGYGSEKNIADPPTQAMRLRVIKNQKYR